MNFMFLPREHKIHISIFELTCNVLFISIGNRTTSSTIRD